MNYLMNFRVERNLKWQSRMPIIIQMSSQNSHNSHRSSSGHLRQGKPSSVEGESQSPPLQPLSLSEVSNSMVLFDARVEERSQFEKIVSSITNKPQLQAKLLLKQKKLAFNREKIRIQREKIQLQREKIQLQREKIQLQREKIHLLRTTEYSLKQIEGYLSINYTRKEEQHPQDEQIPFERKEKKIAKKKYLGNKEHEEVHRQLKNGLDINEAAKKYNLTSRQIRNISKKDFKNTNATEKP